MVGPSAWVPLWLRRRVCVEQGVEAAELPLVDQAVLVDPRGERLEPRGVQVDGAALGVAGTGDQLGLLQHLDVLGDRLLGDLERFGQFVDGGRAPAEPGDDAPPDGIGQGQEGRVEAVVVTARVRCHCPCFSCLVLSECNQRIS